VCTMLWLHEYLINLLLTEYDNNLLIRRLWGTVSNAFSKSIYIVYIYIYIYTYIYIYIYNTHTYTYIHIWRHLLLQAPQLPCTVWNLIQQRSLLPRKVKASLLDSAVSHMRRRSGTFDVSWFFVYMGCSDVCEFEHIYGQIVTTPSCVYDR